MKHNVEILYMCLHKFTSIRRAFWVKNMNAPNLYKIDKINYMQCMGNWRRVVCMMRSLIFSKDIL